jgi:hypothetical protein
VAAVLPNLDCEIDQRDYDGEPSDEVTEVSK